MDILCPQTSLMGIIHGHADLNKFDIYNVTRNQYEKCETGGK